MMPVALVALLALVVVVLVLQLLLMQKVGAHAKLLEGSQAKVLLLESGLDKKERTARDEYQTQAKMTRDELATRVGELQQVLSTSANTASQAQQRQSQMVIEQFNTNLESMVKKLDANVIAQREEAERLRAVVEARLTALQQDNTAKLETIRATVDEKLQGTLEKRLGESFKQVSERLEQVHAGLGAMKQLEGGVTDLKRVLTNVKTRGTWGEVQLGALLDQVLTTQQYSKNVAVKPDESHRVEFAIRLPGKEEREAEVWLPIDSKFPQEDYLRLVAASERANHEEVEEALLAIDAAITRAAKDISEKYIAAPHTTDFAILFLPTEGLYAEVLRRPGLGETLQGKYRVVIAGPSTLLAMLNSLQMGFRTLAIHRQTNEVWQVLGAVKTEFEKFGSVMSKVKKKIDEAAKSVDDISVRQRAMSRKLRKVESLPHDEVVALLGDDEAPLDSAEGEIASGEYDVASAVP